MVRLVYFTHISRKYNFARIPELNWVLFLELYVFYAVTPQCYTLKDNTLPMKGNVAKINTTNFNRGTSNYF